MADPRRPASRRAAAAALALALLAAPGAFAGDGSAPAGALFFERQDHAFGSLLQGVEAWHDFPFEVRGEEPVTIKRVRSTCGCTVPILQVGGEPYAFGTPIAPGSKGFLRARLRTYEFVGAKTSQITVYTDGEPSSVTLGISSFVRRFFDLTPEYLNLGEVVEGETPSAEVTVLTAEAGEFSIEGWGTARMRREVPLDDQGRPEIGEEELRAMELEDANELEPAPEGVAVEWERLEPNRWKLRVELDTAALGTGAFLHTLRFGTDLRRSFDLRVQGVVQPLVTTRPSPRLAFGLLRQGAVLERTLEIVDYDPDHELEVRAVRISSPEWAEHLQLGSLPADPQLDAEGRPTWSLVVKTAETLPKGGFEAELEIETDHPKYPVLRVPVTGFVR